MFFLPLANDIGHVFSRDDDDIGPRSIASARKVVAAGGEKKRQLVRKITEPVPSKTPGPRAATS